MPANHWYTMLPTRRLFLLLFVILTACVLLLTQQQNSPVASAQSLKSSSTQKWYRGNLHTHSLWSDGDDYLENISQWYLDHGYQFLAFTDHNVLADRERWIDIEKNKGGKQAFEKLVKASPANWIEKRERDGRTEVRMKRFDEVANRYNQPGKFLLLQGQEITDSLGKLPVHLNATNIQQLLPPRHGSSVAEIIQNNTDALIAQRERTKQPMLIHVAHPNFGMGVTAEDLMRIRGANFFEVYNGHPFVHNSGSRNTPSTERIWDIINTRRLTEFGLPLLFGLATDDGHEYHSFSGTVSNPGRGWVMVLANDLQPASLIEAMEKGRFYSSTGVKLNHIHANPGSLYVEVAPDPDIRYVIEFFGTRKGFDAKHEPRLGKDRQPIRSTERYSPDIGALLAKSLGTQATYKFQGDELFVRSRIVSTRRHPNPSESGEFETAWTQPVYGPGSKKHRSSGSK